MPEDTAAVAMTIPPPANDRAPARIGPGALVLVVGPSGAGKDTLIAGARALLAGDERVVFPRRIVTRPPDATEDNDTLDEAEFDILVRLDRAALWWRAHGLGYALPRSIDEAIGEGRVVVANVSRRVVADALARYARVTVVFVTAPPEVLAARIAARGRESGAAIAERLARSSEALPAVPSLVVIQNVGDPDDGAQRLADVIGDLATATR